MQGLLPEQTNLLNKQGESFLRSSLAYSFSETEQQVLRCFFTNLTGRVCVMHSLPASITSVLTAMYSRMRNPLGLRGICLTFIIERLALDLTECWDQFEGDAEKFLKARNISTLDEFVASSTAAQDAYDNFLRYGTTDPIYLESFANAKRARKFMQRNRDKYGHNSIARMGSVTLLFEGVSVLLAKVIEWLRLGVGYVELSTRFVDMILAERYPIEEHISALGLNSNLVLGYQQRCFSWYGQLLGKNLDGPFPQFLRTLYGPKFEKVGRKDLEHGIGGESYDVLGCLLPASTLTSLACHASGEALPQLLKHLELEGTPECLAASSLIKEELAKVGGDQFVRHTEPTESETVSWKPLSPQLFKGLSMRSGVWVEAFSANPSDSQIRAMLLEQFLYKEDDPDPFPNEAPYLAENLLAGKRLSHDKLPSEFESVTLSVRGIMSFRGWRDLQRQQLSTHNRTRLTPDLGFYAYDKPAPSILGEVFAMAEEEGANLYSQLEGVPPELLEYILPLGFKVGFTLSANLRQHEFCNWQRTKPDVNHEVRQAFLGIELLIRSGFPDWALISRANIASAYLFARYADKVGPIPL